MRVANLRKIRTGERVRIAADVSWEDSPRPTVELRFETDAGMAEGLEPEANAFLTAVALPAMRHGERRIAIDGAVCPRLRDGLDTAIGVLRNWYGSPRRPASIEPREGFRVSMPRRPARSAAFLTGGLDSLHMILRNAAEIPRDHPFAFRDSLAVTGLPDPKGPRTAAAQLRASRLRDLVRSISSFYDLRLVEVNTNVLSLDDDLLFLKREYIGAALASTAHALAGRWSSISIASGRHAARLLQTGTHPLLDPNYSSSALEVHYVGLHVTRQHRLEELAGSPLGVTNLVVCLNDSPPLHLNCGSCEKCVRTMTGLEAAGALSQASQFPVREVTAAMIRAATVTEDEEDYWQELLAPLRARGRDDLAAAVERKIAEARRENGWKGRIRRFDRKALGGSLASLWHRIG